MDDSKPRKTLTLKPARSASDTASNGEQRKRSGARARQVAQAERVREQQRESPPRSADPVTAADASARRSPSDRPAADRPRSGSNRKADTNLERPLRSRERSPRREEPRDAGTPESERPRVQRKPRTPRQQPAETFAVFAPCPQGLEEALAVELQALGFEDARIGRAGCHFHGDWTGILRANLYSRLATRILVRVAQGRVEQEDDILELARDTPWERWFGPEDSLRVDTSAIRSPMKSLQYCNLRAKDGICDRLREREGARPDIDTVRPDARVHLFLDENSATLYLDTSGESLFKRGWRLDKGAAPLRENLAAGLLALSDWDPAQPLLDPFCGSGTILIEAAWIALGVPPGIWRPFGFERLRTHDARHWRDLKEDARAHIATQLDSPLIGYDLDPSVIEAAQLNVERAWLTPGSIRFEVGDARSIEPPADSGWIVTNPPYGERMADDDSALWSDFASNLKQHFADWHVSIISSDLTLPQKLRLKPRRKTPLHNGPLDCRLFNFEMVAASYRR